MKLLTGADGFIGKNLDAEFRIARKDCDLRNYESVLKILNRYKPETIIHCAAKHGSAMEMYKNHTAYIQNNILSDLNIIRASKESGVKNLLMLSSITSFDQDSESPFNEDAFNGSVNEKIFGYAYSKKICVGLCKAYQIEFGLNYKSIFLGNTYGPWGSFNENGTVIHNLIYKFINAKNNNKNVYLYGDGKALRNYIYVKDLDLIIEKIIFNKELIEPIIVSSDQTSSVKEIADLIKQKISFEGDIIFESNSILNNQIKLVDITKLKKQIGNFYFTKIDEGIDKIYYINRLFN